MAGEKREVEQVTTLVRAGWTTTNGEFLLGGEVAGGGRGGRHVY